MGTFNYKPFGNDSALDWFWKLEAAKEVNLFLEDTLNQAFMKEIATHETDEVVAASAIIAFSTKEKVTKLPAPQKEWIQNNAYVPTQELIILAIKSIEESLTRSEVKNELEESGEFESWERELKKILELLTKSFDCKLPTRKPKKKRLPRSLYKLVELYSFCPDSNLESKIWKKVEAIRDLDEPSKDTDYDLPLSLFSKVGMLDLVRYLLVKGANPNPPQDLSGSPLAHACSQGHVQIAEELLLHGAELFQEITIDKHTGHPMNFVLDRDEAEPIPYRFSQALFFAARSGTPEIIDFLQTKGCDINQCDLNGETLLHKAAESGNLDMVSHLIKLGVPADKGKLGHNEPAIHYSVRAKQHEVTRILIELGANVNALDSFRGEEHTWDISPLDIAVDSDDQKMISLLEAHGGLTGEELVNGN